MKTNSLVYKTTLHTKEQTFVIKIRLNDECKNGHQDFSITGTIYEKGKALIDKNMVSGGAIGDKIALNFPKFAIFNRLHLCDYKGIPMHCSANGFYHLKNGFNSKSTGEEFKNEYCEYYRITPAQFEELKNSENEIQFALKLENLGIFEQWENEANKAIKLLESLTGDEFIIDSTKTNYYKPKTEAIIEEIERQKNGYILAAKSTKYNHLNVLVKEQTKNESAKNKLNSLFT